MSKASEHLWLITECYVDTALACALLGVNGVNHQSSCDNVCITMQKRFADSFAVGIIDDDKRKPSYVNEFDNIGSASHIILKKHKSKTHYLILISKAVEDFILFCANEAIVNLVVYGLPSDMEGFKMHTKTAGAASDPVFKRLFRALRHSGQMQLLQSILTRLNKDNYRTNTQQLMALFDN